MKKIALIIFIMVFASKVYGLSETLRPDGAGTYSQFTPSPGVANWENVDEAVADDSTSYNYGGFIAMTNFFDTYTIGD